MLFFLTAFYFLFIGFSRRLSPLPALLKTVVFFGLILVGITEVFGQFNLLDPDHVSFAWLIIDAVLFINNRHRLIPRIRRIPGIKITPSFYWPWIVIILSATLYLVLKVPANNFDSLTYHLSRVQHWAQQHNVDYYPTYKLNQLIMPPFAEYVILQLHLQADPNDNFAGLVQWTAMAISFVAVYLISRRLKLTPAYSLLAVLMAAAVPMGILESTSTQNDYVAGMWLLMIIYFSLTSELFFLAAATALGVLTKTTIYLFAFPFLTLFFIRSRAPMRYKISAAAFIGVAIILVNSGQFYRNLKIFGNPLGINREDYTYTNTPVSWPSAFSNLVRNSALHLTFPYRPVNDKLITLTGSFLRLWGIDPDSPGNTWPETHLGFTRFSISEDYSGNLLHFLLILAAIVFLSVRFFRHRRDADKFQYLGYVVAGYLLFCLILKWQPWHSRLQLPLFLATAPVLAYFLAALHPIVKNIIVIIFVAGTLPYLLLNPNKPLIGPVNVFSHRGNLRYIAFKNLPDYESAVSYIGSLKCRNIGIMLTGESWEYPFWEYSRNILGTPFRIEHLNPGNSSARFAAEPDFAAFRPCAIIVAPPRRYPLAGFLYRDRTYRLAYSDSDRIDILTPVDTLAFPPDLTE